jgi:hypothetical protein
VAAARQGRRGQQGTLSHSPPLRAALREEPHSELTVWWDHQNCVAAPLVSFMTMAARGSAIRLAVVHFVRSGRDCAGLPGVVAGAARM